jgi:long-chain acyl-CoA synthetase
MTGTDDIFGLSLGAALHPDRVAVSDDYGTAYTYAELDSLVNRIIHGLHAAGVHEDEVLAILLDNRAEAIAIHQAAYRGGYLFTPMNPRLRPSELSYLLHDSGARVLFVGTQHLDLVESLPGPTSARVIVIGEAAAGLDELTDGQPDDPVPYMGGGPLSYTSGTTGRPKAVIRERRKPSVEVMKVLSRFGERLGFDPDHDRHLATAPLYHGGPLVSAMHGINLQGSVYLMKRFEPELVLRTIAELGITSAYMVPTMYHRILALPDEVRLAAGVGTLHSVMHTGAPCPPDLKRRMIDWLGPIVYECYASTEALGTYTVCTSQQWLEHPGTVGRPEHDVITIRDEGGRALGPGEVGLIYARTLPGVAPFEYKGDPEKTARAYGAEGDYTVGDMGYLDQDGFLYITGRATDMIITGGVNVYPAEVEQALLRHPGVRDVAVFGVPDEEWGERVVAAVQLSDPSVDADQLLAFVRDQVASYKAPRVVHIVEDLGRDPSGKLRKAPIREALYGVPDPG